MVAPGTAVQLAAGQIGEADWNDLLDLGNKKVNEVLEEARGKMKVHEEFEGTVDEKEEHRQQLGVWMETATAESTGIGKAAQALTAALIAYAAQKDLVAKKEAEEVEGTLVAAMKAALDSCGISVQRYWNATLVGPDCRRFLEKREEILGAIRAAMLSAKYWTPECDGFVQRHTSVLEPLDKVLHLTRKVNALCPSLVRSPPLPFSS